MDFETAKTEFLNLAETFANDADRLHFFNWLGKTFLPEFEHQSGAQIGSPSNFIRGNKEESIQATVMLDKIAGEIRARVPFEAVMPTETIIHPTIGDDSTLNAGNSVHLDAFLYDELGEEELVQEGLLSRSFCQDCGSRNIEDLTFITHSCSKERLELIYCGLLPPLAGKTVIDIGSRIGAVLYGAYYFSKASKIIGVEMNTELCRLQEEIVEIHKLGDRVQIVEGDMCNLGELIRTGDVIILNNVFDWFMLPELQVKMWQFLRTTLATGCLVVSIPSLEESLEPLNTGIDLATWVRPVDMFDKSVQWKQMDSEMETTEVCLYQVI